MLEVGFGKADITAYHPGIGMLGYGRFDQFAEGVAEPLHARAFSILDPDTGRHVVLVVADLCFVTGAVRQGVLTLLAERHGDLGVGERNLLLTANHTHSSPGGYTHHLLYNVTVPGFADPVYRDIVDGITTAVAQAARTRVPGRIRLATGSFDPDEPIAFNRSMKAFLRNPEAAGFRESERSRAVDREMTLLRFEDAAGRPLASLCWFGVHGTCVRGENRLLHPDSKGMASVALEEHARKEWGNPSFVAGFAQGPQGDVTPSACTDPRLRARDGVSDHGLDFARQHGQMQARRALRILQDAATGPDLGTRIGAALRYDDQSCQAVDPRWVGGQEGLTTIPATIGIVMPTGTEEGPGALYAFLPLFRGLNHLEGRYRKLKSLFGLNPPPDRDPRGPRFHFLEPGLGDEGRAFELFKAGRPRLPPWIDPAIRTLHDVARRGGMRGFPWTPTVLPAQILLLGPLAIVGLPSEITLTAGRRLARAVTPALAEAGVTRVQVTPFCNAYAHYVTTPEEYLHQHYEAACTLYGRWTLPAWQTRMAALARAIRDDSWDETADLGPRPLMATPEILAAQRWVSPSAEVHPHYPLWKMIFNGSPA